MAEGFCRFPESLLIIMGAMEHQHSQDMRRLCWRVAPAMMCDHVLPLLALRSYVLPAMVANILSARVVGLGWPTACSGRGGPTQALMKCSLQLAGQLHETLEVSAHLFPARSPHPGLRNPPRSFAACAPQLCGFWMPEANQMLTLSMPVHLSHGNMDRTSRLR